MKFAFLLLVLFTLSSCVIKNSSEEKFPPVTKESATPSAIVTENVSSMGESELQGSTEFLAIHEGELTIEDSEKAYEMCVRALEEYYKAVWNGSGIELGTFIDNKKLEQYTQEKIHFQYAQHVSNDTVQDIDPGEWQVRLLDNGEEGFLYIHLPVQINMTVGSYGEVTEFLIGNVNGKLDIVDWYTGTKDSYDFMVRGENETIDNPNIWNDSEWVKKIESKQRNFSLNPNSN